MPQGSHHQFTIDQIIMAGQSSHQTSLLSSGAVYGGYYRGQEANKHDFAIGRIVLFWNKVNTTVLMRIMLKTCLKGWEGRGRIYKYTACKKKTIIELHLNEAGDRMRALQRTEKKTLCKRRFLSKIEIELWPRPSPSILFHSTTLFENTPPPLPPPSHPNPVFSLIATAQVEPAETKKSLFLGPPTQHDKHAQFMSSHFVFRSALAHFHCAAC